MPYAYLSVSSFLCPVSMCEISFIASQMFTFSVCILVTTSRIHTQWFGVYPGVFTASQCPCISSSGWKPGPWTTQGPASSGSAPVAWNPASDWRRSCRSVAERSGPGRPTETTWSPWFRETEMENRERGRGWIRANMESINEGCGASIWGFSKEALNICRHISYVVKKRGWNPALLAEELWITPSSVHGKEFQYIYFSTFLTISLMVWITVQKKSIYGFLSLSQRSAQLNRA